MKKIFSRFKNQWSGKRPSDSKEAPISSFTTTPTNQPIDTNSRKVRLIVEGLVQGVGFRYSTKQVADRIGVYGIVRNENDGTVYIEVNGEPEKVNAFVDSIRQSPSPSARVDYVTLEEDETIEERIKFTISN